MNRPLPTRLARAWHPFPVLVFALIVGGCSGDVVHDLRYRSYYRVAYHSSPLNFLSAFNLSKAQEVWGSNFTMRYNTLSTSPPDGEFLGYGAPCELNIITTDNSGSLSSSQWPLVSDSGFRMDATNSLGDPIPHPDGQRLFDAYFLFETPDTVPVFVLPRLIRVDANGQDLWRGVRGLAQDGDIVGVSYYVPSIWINSRVAQLGIPSVGEPGTPQSTFAHEIGHILLNEPSAFPTSIWGNESTVFLHIQSLPLGVKLVWNSTQNAVVQVTVTDLNRQVLIQVDGRDECFEAKASRYVKLEII